MNRIIFPFFLLSFLALGIALGQSVEKISTRALVQSVFEMGKNHCELDFYAGTLMLHGMSEYALLEGNKESLQDIISIYRQFGSGEIKAHGNFISYEAGGSGAAYLSWKKATRVLDEQVADAAQRMMRQQKRTPDNLMTAPDLTHEMFIDVAFAVTPFLLYAGLQFNQPEYVDYAVFQTLESFKILHDKATGLIHQGRGFQGKGLVSDDCWSRGNGWGAFALAILARDLPKSHPKRGEVEELSQQFFTSVLSYQNNEGLWHQEMTAPESYVETSGSGLLLYGLGLVIEAGVIDQQYLENFKKGVSALTSYVGHDGSISHTAFSCRCPKDGSKEVYINHPWVYNDRHAFGPAVLAFTQAAKMGIEAIEPEDSFGKYTISGSPGESRTYVKFARGSDLAWENDRMAYRVFGPSVRGKVANGIDIWVKSVDYPILDKWYNLNEKGKDYHVDRGEGMDFYNMGKRSGCGGISLWINNQPYAPETFDKYRIIKNQDDEIEFDIHYSTWSVPGINVSEQRKIEMVKGTNLFRVTSTIKSENHQDIVVAIGLSTFGGSKVQKGATSGILSVWETINSDVGSLGTVLLIDPNIIEGFKTFNGDEFVLVNVKTNQPFSYYAGAGWSGSGQFSTQKDWNNYVGIEKEKLDK